MRKEGIIFGLLFTVINLFLWSLLSSAAAQDLSGLSIGIDPGHGKGNTNQGPTGLREANINLDVALFLKEFLQSANIDTVLLTRVDDSTNPSLSQREDLANTFGVYWFHSVHHNACGSIGTICTARRTLLLMGEVRSLANSCPDGRAGGTGQPQWPGQADVMSDFMARRIFQALRTSSFRSWLDFSFYGGCDNPKSFSLGVLNDLMMPGELSEATFHQNRVEENKLRNPDFLKLEARALFMAFLDFFEAGTLPTGVIAGIITDEEFGVAIDSAEVLLKPNGSVYTTDKHKNGLYVFHDITPGTYQVVVSAAGFDSKERTVKVNAHDFSFADFSMVVSRPPAITQTLPAHQTQGFDVFNEIGVRFSQPMDRQSVEMAFSTTPFVEGHFIWNSTAEIVLFEPDVRFEFDTEYEVRLTASALDQMGRPLDGNGDGTGGDDFTFTFRTTFLDSTRPVVLDFFPTQRDTGLFVKEVFWAQLNQELEPASVNENTVLLNGDGGVSANIEIDYVQDGSHRLTLVPKQPLVPGLQYFITLTSGLSLKDGAHSGKSFRWQFNTQQLPIQMNILDDFENEFVWADPDVSPFTQQTNPDSTSFQISAAKFISETQAGELSYEFFGHVGFLQSDYLKQLSINIEDDTEIGWYLYGDNSENEIRLFFKDIDGDEALPWTLINWSGWKLLRFNLSHTTLLPGANGNGIINALTIAFGGLQLNFAGQNKGKLYFDDFIEITPAKPISVEPANPELPAGFLLSQNYPNPFNPTTIINYRIEGVSSNPQKVVLQVYNLQGQHIRTLVEEKKPPGFYSVVWDGKNEAGESVSSGLYIYEIRVDHLSENKKMIFLK